MRSRQVLLKSLVGIALLIPMSYAGAYLFEEWQESVLEDALTHGGYVMYLRHADRHSGRKEPLMASSSLDAFRDCSAQRNLTSEGREDAVEIGETLVGMKIPVGRIVALPLCRTRDTAVLAFGHTELDARLYDAEYVRKLLAIRPAGTGNTVLVDTEDQVRRIAGVSLLPGEIAVFRPDGNGASTYVGTLDQDDLDR